MERTHRWLDRCVTWHGEHAPAGQLLYGIVQGGVYEDLRARSTAYVAQAGVDGIAIGGSLGQSKEQMREVVGWSLDDLPEEPPRHLLGIGDVDDLIHAVAAGIDTFDCATPTRLARHGTALVHDPATRWRLDLGKGGHRTSGEPIDERCPCPACREHTRAYLHYLVRAEELTAKRLLTLHNLTFMEELMQRHARLDRGRHARGLRRPRAGGRGVSATTPYWLDEPYEARPPLSGDVEVEACVIGAGVGGLVVRAGAGRARGGDGRARARHRRRRRERPQRRLPAGRTGRVLRRRARALRRRPRARAVLGHARRAGGDLRARRGAGRRRRGAAHRPAASLGIRGGGRARPPSGRRPARRRLPRRAGRARRAARRRCAPASTTAASPTTTAPCTRLAGSARWRARPRPPGRASTSAPRSAPRSATGRS